MLNNLTSDKVSSVCHRCNCVQQRVTIAASRFFDKGDRVGQHPSAVPVAAVPRGRHQRICDIAAGPRTAINLVVEVIFPLAESFALMERLLVLHDRRLFFNTPFHAQSGIVLAQMMV